MLWQLMKQRFPCKGSMPRLRMCYIVCKKCRYQYIDETHSLSLCRAGGPCSWGGHEISQLLQKSLKYSLDPSTRIHTPPMEVSWLKLDSTLHWKMSLFFEKTSLGFKFSHPRNRINTLLLKSAIIQVPACTHHHRVEIEGLESSGRE